MGNVLEKVNMPEDLKSLNLKEKEELATEITGFLKYNNYEDALKMGVSAGSASALSKYLATKEEVYNLFNNI